MTPRLRRCEAPALVLDAYVKNPDAMPRATFPFLALPHFSSILHFRPAQRCLDVTHEVSMLPREIMNLIRGRLRWKAKTAICLS